MINFKEFISFNKFLNTCLEDDDLSNSELNLILTEASKSKINIRTLTNLIILKINTANKKIRSEHHIDKKLDLISYLIKLNSALTNMNIAASVNDRTIFSNSKNLM